jgi:hypothetical protein
MVIPNTSIEYRAMIGDKDIDETSDLSEYSTNSDEEVETDLILPFENESFNLMNSDSVAILSSDNKFQLNDVDKTVNTIISKKNSVIEQTMENFSSDIPSLISGIHLINSPLDETNLNISKNNILTTVEAIFPKNNEFIEEQSNTTDIDPTSNSSKDTADSSYVIKVKDHQDSEHTQHDKCVTKRHSIDVENILDNSSSTFKKVNG